MTTLGNTIAANPAEKRTETKKPANDISAASTVVPNYEFDRASRRARRQNKPNKE